jgi:hypothetical protein
MSSNTHQQQELPHLPQEHLQTSNRKSSTEPRGSYKHQQQQLLHHLQEQIHSAAGKAQPAKGVLLIYIPSTNDELILGGCQLQMVLVSSEWQQKRSVPVAMEIFFTCRTNTEKKLNHLMF